MLIDVVYKDVKLIFVRKLKNTISKAFVALSKNHIVAIFLVYAF